MTTARHTRRRTRAAFLALTAITATTVTAAPAMATQVPDNDSAQPLSVQRIDYQGEGSGGLGSVSRTSCDINGDGYDDALFGDLNWNRPGADQTGAAYVVFGNERVQGGDIDDYSTVNSVRIDGPSNTPTAWVGYSVACLGDVNGDNIDDIALGTFGRAYGTVHVVFGATNFDSLDLDFLGTRGFGISDPISVAEKKNFGSAVGEVGDVNGDGYADIGIANLLHSTPLTSAGQVTIIAGGPDVSDVNVQDPQDQEDRVLFTVSGAAASDRLWNVEVLGDVNGDGIDDIGMSAYVAKPWPGVTSAPGAAYVVYGNAEPESFSLANLGNRGFAVYGPKRGGDRLGMSLAGAGDVNNDGFADLIIGAQPSSSSKLGGAAVVYGAANNNTVLTDPDSEISVFTCADGAIENDCVSSEKQARGYWITSADATERLGYSVGSIADVNNDGSRDLIVGGQAKGTWLVYSQQRTAALDLASVTDSQALKLSTDLGSQVGTVGDLDGNGVADVASGAGNKVGVFLLGALNTEVNVTVPQNVAFGDVAQVQASVLTLVPAGQSKIAGAVSFSVAGAPQVGCQNVALDAAGTAVCDIDFADAQPTEHAVTVAYVPVDQQTKPATTTARLHVHKAATAINALQLSATSYEFGSTPPTVIAQVDGVSDGVVEFFAGNTPLGTASVGTNGTAVFVVPDTLQSGNYSLSAQFVGNDFYAASTRSAAVELTVVGKQEPEVPGTGAPGSGSQNPSPTPVVPTPSVPTPAPTEVTQPVKNSTSVSRPELSASTVVYGSEKVTVTTTVSGASAGKVQFKAGSKTLGTATVSGGKASITLPKTQKVGTYSISAKFLGSSQALASTSKTVKLTVSKASVKAQPKLKIKAVTKGSKPTVKVTLDKLNNGAYPTGKVRITAGKVTKTVTIKKSHKGVLSVKLGKISKKTTVKVKYLGDTTTKASKTSVGTAKIK